MRILLLLFSVFLSSASELGAAEAGSLSTGCNQRISIITRQLPSVRAGDAFAKTNTGVRDRFYPRDRDELSAVPVESFGPPEIEIPDATIQAVIGKVISFPPYSEEPVMIPEQYLSREGFAIVDLIGRKLFYRKKSERPGTATYTREFFIEKPAIYNGSRDFRIPDDKTTFARELAERQLARSTTFRDGAPEKKNLIRFAQELVNYQILQKIASASPITTDDLEHWTEIVTESDPHEDPLIRRFLWVIRDTQKSFTRGNTDYFVDTSGLTIWMDITERNVFQPTPPEKVVVRLREILALFNSLSRDSNPNDAIRVFREYLLIHPTADGNGRIARALLDGAFVKLGIYPKAVVALKTPLAMFSSEADTANLIYRALTSK
jgi:hypothetical protein